MGEKIEILGDLKVKSGILSVEANTGLKKHGGRDIHLQNSMVRFQMYEYDFIHFLSKIGSAKTKLDRLKLLK